MCKYVYVCIFKHMYETPYVGLFCGYLGSSCRYLELFLISMHCKEVDYRSAAVGLDVDYVWSSLADIYDSLAGIWGYLADIYSFC